MHKIRLPRMFLKLIFIFYKPINPVNSIIQDKFTTFDVVAQTPSLTLINHIFLLHNGMDFNTPYLANISFYKTKIILNRLEIPPELINCHYFPLSFSFLSFIQAEIIILLVDTDQWRSIPNNRNVYESKKSLVRVLRV